MIGQRLAHFRIVEQLGAGGMGVVYRAHDEQLDREVAIKVLPAASFHDPHARARLLREARTASKLNHPNICTIHEVGEADGQAFIAMELIEGRTLSARLAGGALPVNDALRYGVQLADALAHAHKRGVMHRDLKCANVIITPDDQAKVLDFGLAKQIRGESLAEATTQTELTQPGAVVGTLAYMAPEQFRGRPADARSDIWALGVMLYEMAAGVRPFGGQTGFEISSAILNQPPPPLPSGLAGAPPAELETAIRHCLEKDPARRYQTSGEVRAALEAVQSGGPLPVVPAWKTALSRRRWLVVGAPLAAGVAGAVAFDVGGVRTRLMNLAVSQRFRSLAVLPFTNPSGDPAQEYFADGITDALITDVSKIGSLKVISRTSVMQYKGAKKPLPEIARALNVETVLEGSVVREANRVRVSAQLIEASANRNIWAENFERELTSILALLNDVARAIAREVRAKLRPQEQTRLTRARKVNPKVYEACLRGKYYVSQNTPGSFDTGMKFLREAVEIDPEEPLAHIRLAEGYVTLGHGGAEQQDSFPRARAAAGQALRLDPNAAEAFGVLADVALYYEWDWARAENLFKRALELNPSHAMTHYHYAWYLALFNRLDEAIVEHKLARDHDPLQALHTGWLAQLYIYGGRYDEAIVEARKALELNPRFWGSYLVLQRAYSHKGQHEEAIAAAQRLLELAPVVGNATLGIAYVSAGQREQALAVAAKLKRGAPITSYILSPFYLALGDRDAAVRELEAAYQAHVTSLPWIRVHGGPWDSLRDDPRFQDLLRRMKLPL